MSKQIVCLGAIDKKTNEYVYPNMANKENEYICPDCNKDLILCQGEIKRHHFRHHTNSDRICDRICDYYDKPSESQIHKDAKRLLKKILEQNIEITFTRKCICCKENEVFQIPKTTINTKIEVEYRFEYNGSKTADVAYLDNNKILYIFEICHTHKTNPENRPEPWFEINAINFINKVNDNGLINLQIACIRGIKCKKCLEKNDGKLTLTENNIKYEDINYDIFKKNNIVKIEKHYSEIIFYDTNNSFVFFNASRKWGKIDMYKIIEWYFSSTSYNDNYKDDVFYECCRCGDIEPNWIKYVHVFNNVCTICDIELYSRIYLNVEYDEKDEAKKLGIKWDTDFKKWYTFEKNKNIDIILKKWDKCFILKSDTSNFKTIYLDVEPAEKDEAKKTWNKMVYV